MNSDVISSTGNNPGIFSGVFPYNSYIGTCGPKGLWYGYFCFAEEATFSVHKSKFLWEYPAFPPWEWCISHPLCACKDLISFPALFGNVRWSNISKTSASVSSEFQTRENLMKARGRRAPSAFIFFEVFETPDETRSTSFWKYFSNKRKLV